MNVTEENNNVASTEAFENQLDWQAVPDASAYQLWLNSEPKKLIIPGESKKAIESLKSRMSIDYLRVVSQWSHGISVPMRLLKSGTLSFNLQPSNQRFILHQKLKLEGKIKKPMQGAEHCTMYVGRIFNVDCWVEITGDGENIPEFFLDEFQILLAKGLSSCQEQGFNIRHLISFTKEDGSFFTNIKEVDEIEITGAGFDAFVQALLDMERSSPWSPESYGWFENRRCRLVAQRYGQDHVVNDDGSLEKYLNMIFENLEMSFAVEVHVALATNVFPESESGFSTISLTPDGASSIFRGVQHDCYAAYYLKELCRVQAKGAPAPFVEALQLPDCISVRKTQIYHTSKAILRPTSYEEPFKNMLYSKAAVQKNKISPAQLAKLMKFHDIGFKFAHLKQKPGGLRVEIEFSIDLSQVQLDAQSASQLISVLQDSANPFDIDEQTLFEQPLTSIAICLDSKELYSYAQKMFNHLCFPLQKLLKMSMEKRLTPDHLEIIVIFERLLRIFMSGSERYISRNMRLLGIKENLVLFGIPFFPIQAIDLRSGEVDWSMCLGDGEIRPSFTGFMDPLEQKYQMIRLNISVDFRRCLERYKSSGQQSNALRELMKMVDHFVTAALAEFRVSFLKHFFKKTDMSEEETSRDYQTLGNLGDTFFGRSAVQVISRHGQIYNFRRAALGVSEMAKEICSDGNAYSEFQFKRMIVEIMKLVEESGICEKKTLINRVKENLIARGVAWFFVPLKNTSMKNLCLVSLQNNYSDRNEVSEFGIATVSAPGENLSNDDEENVETGTNTDVLRHHNSLRPLRREDLGFDNFHELKNPLVAALQRLNEKIRSNNSNERHDPLPEITENTILNALDLNNPIHLYVVLLCQLILQGKLNSEFHYTSFSTAGAALLHFVLLDQHFRTGAFEKHLKHFNGSTGSCFQNYKVGKHFFTNVKAISHFKKYRIPHPDIQGVTIEQLLAITSQRYESQLAFFSLSKVLEI